LLVGEAVGPLMLRRSLRRAGDIQDVSFSEAPPSLQKEHP
jgi:hypothetical protein